MGTVMEAVEGEGMASPGRKEETSSCITTTLEELLAALQDMMGPENDAQVVATVTHLLRSGRLTFPRQARRRRRMRPWEHS